MRGVSFVSFSGPAVSALNACAPPTPRRAESQPPGPGFPCHRSTPSMAPHVDRQRQLIEPGKRGGPGRRQARHCLEVSVGDRQSGNCSRSGKVANAGKTVQTEVTSKKPSRACNSRRNRRVDSTIRQTAACRDEQRDVETSLRAVVRYNGKRRTAQAASPRTSARRAQERLPPGA